MPIAQRHGFRGDGRRCRRRTLRHDPRRHRRVAPAPTGRQVACAAPRSRPGCRGSSAESTSEPTLGGEHLIDVDAVAASVRAAQADRIDRHRQCLREVRGTPDMGAVARADELEHAFGQLDPGVDVAVLFVAVGDRRCSSSSPIRRRRSRAPAFRAPAATPRSGSSSSTPCASLPRLHCRNGTSHCMVGPHLRWLDLQALPQARCHRAPRRRGTARRDARARPSSRSARPRSSRPTNTPAVCVGVPTPPPPRLDGDICVTGLVGGSEQHVDPAD